MTIIIYQLKVTVSNIQRSQSPYIPQGIILVHYTNDKMFTGPGEKDITTTLEFSFKRKKKKAYRK